MNSSIYSNPLYVFFSFRTSMESWESVGLITELKPFISISQSNGTPIVFVTYGSFTSETLVLNRYLPDNVNIKILSPKHSNKRLGFLNLLAFFILLIKTIPSYSNIFSIQTSSLFFALPLALFKRCNLVSRSGFDHIDFISRLNPFFHSSTLLSIRISHLKLPILYLLP